MLAHCSRILTAVIVDPSSPLFRTSTPSLWCNSAVLSAVSAIIVPLIPAAISVTSDSVCSLWLASSRGLLFRFSLFACDSLTTVPQQRVSFNIPTTDVVGVAVFKLQDGTGITACSLLRCKYGDSSTCRIDTYDWNAELSRPMDSIPVPAGATGLVFHNPSQRLVMSSNSATDQYAGALFVSDCLALSHCCI
jgi:hypothetical protein